MPSGGEPHDSNPGRIDPPVPGLEAHGPDRPPGIHLGNGKVIPERRIGTDPVLHDDRCDSPFGEPLPHLPALVISRQHGIAPARQDDHPCSIWLLGLEEHILRNFGMGNPPAFSPRFRPGLGTRGTRRFPGPQVNPSGPRDQRRRHQQCEQQLFHPDSLGSLPIDGKNGVALTFRCLPAAGSPPRTRQRPRTGC